jgi:hypothetical protein
MRVPSLSIAPTPTPISYPRTWNHLSIEAPPAASVERNRVVISAAPSSSDDIGENPRRPPLSPSYHNDLPSLRAAVLPHVHESTMDRERVVVQWFIDLIYDFSYTKTIPRNLENAKTVGKALDFFNKFRNNSYIF